MNHCGLSESVIAQIHAILKHYPVETAILYGSRAKGNYKNGSDIDLTLMGKSLNYSDLLSINDDFEDSFIPHRIDVSIFDHLENPELKEHIQKIGIIFYQRTNN